MPCGSAHAVRPPQIAPVAAAGMVAVLDEIARLVDAAGAQVDRQVDLGPGALGPGGELVGADLVRLGRHPGQIEAPRPLRHRPHAVPPVVAGDEIAAGIADEGHAQLAHQFQHVPAKPHLVRGRMPRLVDAAVDRPAQMLDERAVEPGIDLADAKILVDDDACRRHEHTTPSPSPGRMPFVFPYGTAARARPSIPFVDGTVHAPLLGRLKRVLPETGPPVTGVVQDHSSRERSKNHGDASAR